MNLLTRAFKDDMIDVKDAAAVVNHHSASSRIGVLQCSIATSIVRKACSFLAASGFSEPVSGGGSTSGAGNYAVTTPMTPVSPGRNSTSPLRQGSSSSNSGAAAGSSVSASSLSWLGAESNAAPSLKSEASFNGSSVSLGEATSPAKVNSRDLICLKK